MNPRHPAIAKKNHSQSYFPACQEWAILLKTKMAAATAPFRGGAVLAFISLFERWFLSTDSQAGEFLLGLIEARAAQAVVAWRSRNHKIQGVIRFKK
jgi:hypothetical protein